MAQYQENQQTIGKAKNSKVYVAKGANSFEVNGEHQREFPSREAVMQMKSFFEKTHSDNNSVEKSDQVLPVLNGNAETLFQSHESLRGTGISEYSFETQISFPGRKTGSNDSLSNSETKSSVHINTIKDSSEININEGQVAKPIRPAGSMLLQPASNVRGPMVKAEYLKLNKFNDITVYSGSGQKRGMVSVDELDRKIDENSAIAFVVLADNSFSDDSDELLLTFDSDYVVEFEGAGLTIGRSTLKASKSLEREKRVTFDCHLESVFEYPAEPITPDSLSTQRPTCDSEVSHGCSTDAANAFPDIVNGKTLPSYPVCNGSGCLGFYQPRLLEKCSVVQFYGADSFSDRSTVQQSERINSMPMEKFKVTAAAVTSSCSAEESSWSGGNTGTELLF